MQVSLEPDSKPVTILVVDDRRLARIAAKAILDDTPELAWVGEASNGVEAVNMAARLRPMVVLLDVEMPGVDGAETARLLKHEDQELNILAWTVSEESGDLLRMLDAGCSGYVLKDCSPNELRTAIQVAVRNETAIPRKMLGNVLREAALYVPRLYYERAALTNGELQVLRMLAKGRPTKQIATSLHIASSSVESHIKSIYRKLDVNSRSAALGVALKQGLIRVSDL